MDNPQAFPMPSGPEPRVNSTTHYNEGMTLLDYFAGEALIGIMANVEYLKAIQNPKPQETIAFNCFEIAQAMLKQRELIMKGK